MRFDFFSFSFELKLTSMIFLKIHFQSFTLLFVQHSDAKEIDLQFSLEDLETIKVIGKGSGGIVQLVRHKWIGRLFALKVGFHKTQIS